MSRVAFNQDSLVGKDIVKLITSGLNANPLSIYREYVQNAADSIEKLPNGELGTVEIEVDLANKRVTIHDCGVGLSIQQVEQELVPFAKSNKSFPRDRGFRGIGRLSALPYCAKLKFLTREDKSAPVIQVTWDSIGLRRNFENFNTLEELVSKFVTIESLEEKGFADRFFEVQIEGIPRFIAASILNKHLVREYIAETCPVPLNPSFPFYSIISNRLSSSLKLLNLPIYLNNNSLPILRPQENEVLLPSDKSVVFTECEEFQIPDLSGTGVAAYGWIAHSTYSGVISNSSSIRCIRARLGNIQIGDETVFDHLFTESRFNRWCVAEVHIVDSNIVPVGSRDYFEPSPHLRNFENHLRTICRQIEKRCRAASRKRNQKKKLMESLNLMEQRMNLVETGYLSANLAETIVSEINDQINELKASSVLEFNKNEESRFNELASKVHSCSTSGYDFMSSKFNSKIVHRYRKVFSIIADTSPNPSAAINMIECILERLKD